VPMHEATATRRSMAREAFGSLFNAALMVFPLS
jgi:hypothetical protein